VEPDIEVEPEVNVPVVNMPEATKDIAEELPLSSLSILTLKVNTLSGMSLKKNVVSLGDSIAVLEEEESTSAEPSARTLQEEASAPPSARAKQQQQQGWSIFWCVSCCSSPKPETRLDLDVTVADAPVDERFI